MKFGETPGDRLAVYRRPPRGGRGLKSNVIRTVKDGLSRPPRGGRGLKCPCLHGPPGPRQSPPSRGAWIEIVDGEMERLPREVAPLAGGVD